MKLQTDLTKKLTYFVVSSSLEYRELIKKHLLVGAGDANKIISSKEGRLLHIPYDQVIRNCEIFRNLKVDINPVEDVSSCLKLTSFTLKHRIVLLYEMGIPTVNTKMISRLPYYMGMSVTKFKQHLNIPADQSIAENILKHGEILPDAVLMEQLSESLPVRYHYKECFNYYKLHQPIFNNSRLWSMRKRQYKSLGLMTQLLKILREDIGLDVDFIRKHIYLLEYCSDNIHKILEELKEIKIAGMDLQEVIRKWPEILACDVNNIKQLLQTFKKYNINDESLRKYIKILALRNSTFIRRMNELTKDENIRVWSKYPRFPLLLLRENTVKYRAEYLRLVNQLEWATVNSFLCPKQHFLRRIEKDQFAKNRQQYMKYVFRNEFGEEKFEIMELLLRHPHWNQVPIKDIIKTIRYLKKDFTREDIYKNIHIILYQRARVKRMLLYAKEMYASDKQHSFTNCQWLSLCLYMLEKDNHFTGDGIW